MRSAFGEAVEGDDEHAKNHRAAESIASAGKVAASHRQPPSVPHHHLSGKLAHNELQRNEHQTIFAPHVEVD